MIFHKYQKCTRAKKSKITMVHKYQQCTRTYFLGQMIGHSLKNIFDSLGFTYDFAFCQNNGFSKRTMVNVLQKRSYIPIFFWGGRGGKKLSWVQNWENFEIFDVHIDINNIFPGWFHNFSCIFWSILVIIRRSTGPDFDDFFEVPEIIQKVLEYDRGP